MSEPLFLTLEQVLELHERSIAAHGGTLGIRDQNGLESAINHPKNVFWYSAGDLFDIAAADAFHIAEGQCFLDGNKRTAATAALINLPKDQRSGIGVRRTNLIRSFDWNRGKALYQSRSGGLFSERGL